MVAAAARGGLGVEYASRTIRVIVKKMFREVGVFFVLILFSDLSKLVVKNKSLFGRSTYP